jgi:hemerythrin superfamily protein
MDAIEMLKSDHQKVDRLFQLINQTADSAEKREIFNQIREELELHAQVEESIFYPACQEFEEVQDQLEEALEEHNTIKDLLEEIEDTTDTEEVTDLIDELIETVQHHVEEEEDEFFPKIRDLMDKSQLEQLAILMADAKEDAQAAA